MKTGVDEAEPLGAYAVRRPGEYAVKLVVYVAVLLDVYAVRPCKDVVRCRPSA